MVLGHRRADECAVNGRIFREEALRRPTGSDEPSRTAEPGTGTFVALWLVVAVLVTVLALLAWPLLGAPGGGR